MDWALQISDGSIVITETPTTGVIQMASLTVGDIVLTGTATGNFGAGGAAIIGTSPISVATAAGTSTISLNASYSTTSHLHDSDYVNVGGDTMSGQLLVSSATTTSTVGFGEIVVAKGTSYGSFTVNAADDHIHIRSKNPIEILAQSSSTMQGIRARGLGVNSTHTYPTLIDDGITFGEDANLYRVSANALKTDDALEVVGTLTNGGTSVSLSTHTHAYQPAGTYVTAVNGTAPITASTDTAGIVTVGLSANYASSVHTHDTSSITSGNFVATITQGTGVTVSAQTGNAATPTVSIGQAVATTDAVSFASVNKLAITAPATSATLAIANAKTLTVSNTLTLTGTDSVSASVGNGGSLVPAGVVHIYMGANTSLPTGWLLCDGTAVSRTTYATLFGVVSTNFGTGDGSTTFNLPDLTGTLIVGSSVIPGASFQTGSTDAYLNSSWTHAHSHSHVTDPAATTSGSASSSGAGMAGTGITYTPQTHTHSTNIAATTSDTDATNSPTVTFKRTKVNYIIKW